MTRILYRLATIATTVAFVLAAGAIARPMVAKPQPLAIGCGPGGARLIAGAMPLTYGPYRLEMVRCFPLPPSSFPVSAPLLSPDEARYFAYDDVEGLWTGSVKAGTAPKLTAARLAVLGLGYSGALPFVWTANSRAILGARQETAQSSGFALGPVQTILIGATGVRALPALRHPAGPLDGVLWVGASGLAIAEFGTKGSYYRPEHVDPNPTLALVDARRGIVLQAIPMPGTSGKPDARIHAIEARVDSRGRMIAVFLSGVRWYLWRQGKQPRPLPLSSAGESPRRIALSPDASTVLVARDLSATGVICEHDPKCPKPTPQTGIIAELRDLATGRVRWRISGTATTFSRSLDPAISPDGSVALVSVPQNGGEPETIAILAMDDGRVLQRLPRLWPSDTRLTFGPRGYTIRLSGGSFLAIYRRVSRLVTTP